MPKIPESPSIEVALETVRDTAGVAIGKGVVAGIEVAEHLVTKAQPLKERVLQITADTVLPVVEKLAYKGR